MGNGTVDCCHLYRQCTKIGQNSTETKDLLISHWTRYSTFKLTFKICFCTLSLFKFNIGFLVHCFFPRVEWYIIGLNRIIPTPSGRFCSICGRFCSVWRKSFGLIPATFSREFQRKFRLSPGKAYTAFLERSKRMICFVGQSFCSDLHYVITSWPIRSQQFSREFSVIPRENLSTILDF